MSGRATLILLVLAVLVVTAALLTERAAPIARARARAEAMPVLDAPPSEDGLVRVRLERADEPALLFARGLDGWEQVEPFSHPMDTYSMRRFARLAAELRSVDRLEPGEGGITPAVLGLDPPRAVLTLEDDGGRRATLELGRRGIGGRAYLRRAGEEAVYVVGQELHERALEMDPREWRDRSLFRAVGLESDRIEIGRPDSPVRLVRDRRTWRMELPVRTRLSPEARDALLSALSRGRSSGFLLDEPRELASFGLDPPAGTVTVHTTRRREEGGEIALEPIVETLRIGARVGAGSEDRFALVEGRPTVVRVPEALLRAVFGPPELLTDATASGVLPADVKVIRIAVDGHDFELERDVDRWVAPGENDRPVPRDVVERLLGTLTSVRASSIRFGDWPRELERGHVTFLGWDRAPIDTVRIARDPSGAWILENGDRVLRIHTANLDLPLAPEAYGLSP